MRKETTITQEKMEIENEKIALQQTIEQMSEKIKQLEASSAELKLINQQIQKQLSETNMQKDNAMNQLNAVNENYQLYKMFYDGVCAGQKMALYDLEQFKKSHQ